MEFLKKPFRPLLKLWRSIPLFWQGVLQNLLPFAAVLISGALALYGSQQRERIETDLQRHFHMTRALGEVLSTMLNAETGMRGYLLTKREHYLAPYQKARSEIDNDLTEINELAQAEPADKPRQRKTENAARLKDLITRQLADLEFQHAHAESPEYFDPEFRRHFGYANGLMDEIRALIGAMTDEEGELLTDRIEEINSIRRRDYIVIFITLFLGFATRIAGIILFRLGVVRRVENLTENVRAIREGAEELPHEPEAKPDELFELESEIKELIRVEKTINAEAEEKDIEKAEAEQNASA